MGWRYSRRITVFPCFKLNFTGKGISTTVGVPGASINFGKKGVFLNTSIPGTGFYRRDKLSEVNDQTPISYFMPNDIHANKDAEIPDYTSEGLKSLEESLHAVKNEKTQLESERDAAMQHLSRAEQSFRLIKLIPFCAKVFPRLFYSKENDAKDSKESIEEIDHQLSGCFIQIDDYLPPNLAEQWKRSISCFAALRYVYPKWVITQERFIDPITSRSRASREIEREELRVEENAFQYLNPNNKVPCLVSETIKIYFYPQFIIIQGKSEDFSLIEYSEIELRFSETRVTESGQIPKESNIVDYTWRFVNKDGSPDRRYSGNYPIPIVLYGEISIKSENRFNIRFLLGKIEEPYNYVNELFKYQVMAYPEISRKRQEDQYWKERQQGSRSKEKQEKKADRDNNKAKAEGSKRDPYEVLGIKRGATRDDIKKAYYEKIKEYHPDKVATLGEDLKKLAEERTKEINEAFKNISE